MGEIEGLRKARPLLRLRAERLVEENSGLAAWGVRKVLYLRVHQEGFDDAMSIALTTLWKSALSWCEFGGSAFGTFAGTGIVRAMLREKERREAIGRRPLHVPVNERTMGESEGEAPVTCLPSEVLEAIGTLHRRDQRYLREYYGLESGESRTFAAVAADEGVTRERGRQVFYRALHRLKVKLGLAEEVPEVEGIDEVDDVDRAPPPPEVADAPPREKYVPRVPVPVKKCQSCGHPMKNVGVRKWHYACRPRAYGLKKYTSQVGRPKRKAVPSVPEVMPEVARE